MITETLCIANAFSMHTEGPLVLFHIEGCMTAFRSGGQSLSMIRTGWRLGRASAVRQYMIAIEVDCRLKGEYYLEASWGWRLFWSK